MIRVFLDTEYEDSYLFARKCDKCGKTQAVEDYGHGSEWVTLNKKQTELLIECLQNKAYGLFVR